MTVEEVHGSSSAELGASSVPEGSPSPSSSVRVCSRVVWCASFEDGVDFNNLWRFGWSDSLLADQVYALVRLLLGLGIFTFSVVDFVLDSPRAVSKLWYLSYWGLYASSLYMLSAGVLSVVQFFGPQQPGSHAQVQQEVGPGHPPPSGHPKLQDGAKAPIIDDAVHPARGPRVASQQQCCTCCVGATSQVREVEADLQPPSTCPAARAVCSLTTVTQAQGYDPLLRKPAWCRYEHFPWVHRAVLCVFGFALGFGWVITPLFWGLLYDPAGQQGFGEIRNALIHSAIMYPLLDVALGRIPVLSQFCLNVVYAMLVYAFINAMYSLSNPGKFLYSFMTWQEPGSSIGVILGVAALTTAAWFGTWAAARSRDLAARSVRAQAAQGQRHPPAQPRAGPQV